MASYTECPCCSGKRRTETATCGVFKCRRCDALYGDCYKGDSYSLVLPYMADAEIPADRCRYFDLTVLGADGITRRHGWFDVESKRIVQIG